MIDESTASRTFGVNDQQVFARLSGDFNPLHLDPVFARRTQAGALVVHGIHILLWVMDVASGWESALVIQGIKARFHKPLFVGELACMKVRNRSGKSLVLDVFTQGTLVASVTLSSTSKRREGWAVPSASALPEELKMPRDISFEEMAGRSGTVSTGADEYELRQLLPAVCASIGTTRVRALLGASQIVGMACPGLHSLFAGLEIACAPTTGAGSALSYEVSKVDARFRSVMIAIAGLGVTGELEAFARLPPPAQAPINVIMERVPRNAFEGQTALVVGGSRGLGEVTAKIIAAGGGHPVITFKESEREAQAVATAIRNGGGRCDVLRYDVLSPAADQLRTMDTLPHHCYYFATRKIFERKSDLYEVIKFREFLDYYVDGFHDLCRYLVARAPGGVSIFYPSTIAINESAETIAEYAMAKAAGEILGKYLGEFVPNIRVISRRLPRILTDQTAVVGVAAAQDALEVMLPIVLDVQSR